MLTWTDREAMARPDAYARDLFDDAEPDDPEDHEAYCASIRAGAIDRGHSLRAHMLARLVGTP